jgi:hypothetical protein
MLSLKHSNEVLNIFPSGFIRTNRTVLFEQSIGKQSNLLMYMTCATFHAKRLRDGLRQQGRSEFLGAAPFGFKGAVFQSADPPRNEEAPRVVAIRLEHPARANIPRSRKSLCPISNTCDIFKKAKGLED